MNTLLISILCFGIIAGRNATTDGYVYLGHNEDQWGEQMLNIYNVPATKDRAAYLWFEFPGQASGDSYANEFGVCIASDQCKSREDRATGSVLYEVRTTAIQKARSAREAVHIIGSLVERFGYADSGRSYLVADQKEGWIVAVVKGRHWVAQRVPDDEIATIPNYYTIGEINLKDTANFLGSQDIIKYARKRGWYKPGRDGAFSFRKAYADPGTLTDSHNIKRHTLAQTTFFEDVDLDAFSRKPKQKFHRRHLSLLLTQEPICNKNTVLTTIFTMNPAFPPKRGTVIWVGLPNQDAASQSQWTVFTKSPETCHRYKTADEALEKHFSDVGDFRKRWPKHFYWHYVDPSTDIEVIPHDFTVFVPKQPKSKSGRDGTKVGDSFNDHFHVLEDPARGLLYAFWTQGSFETANDEHVVFSKSSDGGRTWTEPIIIAGSPTLADPKPVAAWQQPMLSKSGRLYCLWNQETTLKKHLCGIMQGCYSDDCGETWSAPETVPFPIRFKEDPADPAIPPVWCMWQRPLRFGQDGRYLAGCSRYDRNSISRVEFWQYENIDENPEVRDIRISFFNTGEEAFDGGKVENDVAYVAREPHSIEEACIVGLPDGRLFAVMRSSLGHPVWSVSEDNGRHWSRPEILRMRDGGKAILHPRSPCPIYDYAGPEARSGRYFLMAHNSFDFFGMTSYQMRGPLYRLDGSFVPGAHQPVWFSEGTLFSPRDTGNSFYTSYTALNGEGVLWFGDQKFYLFGKRMKGPGSFDMRGVVLSTKELAETDWVRLAASNGINTIGTHITPSEVVAFLSTPAGRQFREDCRKNGISVEHQLHAMGELLPRGLFRKDPSMFRMDSTGHRTPDYNCCAHSEKALKLIAENAAELARILRPDNHRYYFWLDDNAPTCCCEKCREYFPSEQALIIENRMLREIRKVDPKAKLAHLAYSFFMDPPVKVKAEDGIFLEFAPIYRSWDVPLTETGALCPRGYPVTNGDNLRWLEENLKVFSAEDAVVLEYWLDVSLFSRWKRPAVELPWHPDVCASDLATYAAYGIKNVTSFAVYMDSSYFARFPSTAPIEEYGQMLSSSKTYKGLTDWRGDVTDSTIVTISKDAGRLHISFVVKDSTPVFNDSRNERSVDLSDRVEVFLSCDPEMKCYYGFEIDPRGKVMDYRNSYYRQFDYDWHSGITASGKPHKGGYRVDVEFPKSFLEELGVLQEDGSIILGLYRAEAVTPNNINWYSLVDPQTPEPDFHVPASLFRY